MNIKEYNQVKDLSYSDYVNYLLNKYGAVPCDYFTPQYNKVVDNSRVAEGLFIHHIKENEIANLSNEDIAKEYDFEYQKAENLVYCDYLEHYLLHLLIAEESGEGLGIGGIVNYIEPELQNIYKGYQFTNWRVNVANKVIDDKEVYDILHERLEDYQETEDEKSVLKEHNIIVYAQLEETLKHYDRALVVIGTGLGKTTTALEYLRQHNMLALALAPQTNVQEMWDRYDNIEAMTYQGFMTSYKDIDYSKYNILICDEAHHCAAPKWGEGVRYVLNNHIMPVIGLTATPQEKKSKQNFETSREFFQGHVCEGHDLLSAIEQDIVYPFSYVQSIYDTESLKELEEDIDNMELRGRLNLEINNTPTMKEILLRHMPEGKRKGIIFVSEIDAIHEAINIFRDIFPNVEYRPIHSLMPENEIAENKEWFENTDEGYLVSVNMVSEGSHFKGINTIIMFRRTQSKLLYMQQLGRIVVLTENENPNGIVFDLVNNAYALSNQENGFYEDLKYVLRKKEVERQGQQKKWKNIKSKQIIIQDYCEKINDILNQLSSKEKAVICIETQQIYDSIVEAANAHNIFATSISQVCLKKVKIAGGYHWAYVDDLKRQEELKEFIGQEKTSINKSVICIETQQIYNSISEAANAHNINISHISQACLKRKKIAGGYHWAYFNDLERQEELKEFIGKEQTTTNRGKKRAVICVETQQIYNSIREAANTHNINVGHISQACRGNQATAGGYHWIYTDDLQRQEELKEFIGKEKIADWARQVICIETQQIYESIREAERVTGLHSISAICRGEHKTAGGYHWAYLDDISQQEELKEFIGQKPIITKKAKQVVMCVETQQIYDSLTEAARIYNISYTNISNVCRGKKRTAGGCHWKYVEEE